MQIQQQDNRNVQLRDKDRERIEQQIQEFLARGGEIKVLESNSHMARTSAHVADEFSLAE